MELQAYGKENKLQGLGSLVSKSSGTFLWAVIGALSATVVMASWDACVLAITTRKVGSSN